MSDKIAIILIGIVLVLISVCLALFWRLDIQKKTVDSITQRAEALEADNQGLTERNRIIDAEVNRLEVRNAERIQELSEYQTRMAQLREENQDLRELLDTRIPAVCLFGLPVPLTQNGDQ